MTTEVVKNRAEAEKARLEGEIAPLEAQFTGISIKSDADFERVDSDVKMVKRLMKDADTIFDPAIEGYFRPYKFWLGAKKAITDRLGALEKLGKKALTDHIEAKNREREDAERKAAAEAAEKERKEREKLDKRAEKAEASGNVEKAQELRDQAATVHVPAAPVAAQGAPEIKGTTLRYRWTGECVDLLKLAKAVAEGRAPLNLLMANAPAINAQARATRDTFPIDGIKFVAVPDLATSTR